MNQGIAESPSPDQISHDHFKAAIQKDTERYSGFGIVDFDPEIHRLDDVLRPYHGDSDNTAMYVEFARLSLAGEEASDKAEQALKDAFVEYEIPEKIQSESIVINANHIHFADDPLATLLTIRVATRLGIYKSWEDAASHMYEVTARSVDVLATNITNGSVVENGLRHISHILKTMPSSEKGKAIPGLPQTFRRRHNEKFKAAFNAVFDEPGNFVIGNGGGAQETVGRVYEINPPSDEAAGLFVGKNVLAIVTKCVPIIVDQNLAPDENTVIKAVGLYRPDGIEAVDAMYEDTAQVAANTLPAHGYPELEVVRYKDKEFYPQAA